jgi:hypothetical protein
VELGGSLLCSKQPTTGPYPEPDESSPHPHNLFILRFILVFSYTLPLKKNIMEEKVKLYTYCVKVLW